MMEGRPCCLVLGLGNELAGDDAVGLLVAREVRHITDADIEVVESSASGLALIEIFAGYERAIVVDSILTGHDPPGTIREMGMDEVGRVVAPSVHQAGLPELAAVAERLGLTFPTCTRVFAVEVVDPFTLGAPLSAPVAAAIPELTHRVRDLLVCWALQEEPCTTTTR
jgi:hydrogenase maturation protease